MLNKYQKEWANYIVKTEETELLLVDKQKHIPLEISGRNKTTANSSLAKWRVTCFYNTFVVKQTVVLLMNFGVKNPPPHQAENR